MALERGFVVCGVVCVLILSCMPCTGAWAADLGPKPQGLGQEDQPQAWRFDSNGDFVRNSTYFLDQLTYGFNGDLDHSGFRLRVEGSYSHYNYNNSSIPGRTVDADVGYGGGWLGYQFYKGNLSYTAWIGTDYQYTKLTPNDPSNVTRGSAFGFSTEAEVENVGDGPLYFDIDGQYSTGFRTYWSRARIGYRFHDANWVIGPEGTFLGDEGFDNQRVGGFFEFPLHLLRTMSLDTSLAAGYSFAGNGGSGAANAGPGGSSANSLYVTVDVSTAF